MRDPLLILPFAFPVFFVLMWLVIVTILSRLAGWRALSARFPDRDDPQLARFPFASGMMGFGVSMRNILTLTVCRSGLRVAIWKIFGPFDRPFFVPWEQLVVGASSTGFLKRATLHFGEPATGRLQVSATLASQLASAAGDHWPRQGAR